MRSGFRLIAPVCLLGLFAVGCGGKQDMHDHKMPARAAELDRLDKMVGNWEYTMEMSGKDMPAMKHNGTTKVEWDVDKTVMIEHINGDMGEHGQFHGLSMITWDANANVYRTFWIDNLGDMSHGTMTYDAENNVWHGKGKGKNMYTGESKSGRGEHKFVDDNTMEWSGTEYDAWGFTKKMSYKGTSKRKM